jgi:hypothetical protein
MNNVDPKPAAPDALARTLGYGGLLPFVLGMVLCWHAPDLRSQAQHGLQTYAAVIASFLGGMHWAIVALGHSSQPTKHLIWGVMPSLLAWVALALPGVWPLATLGGVLALCYVVDRAGYPQAGMGAWLPLRLNLTLVAVMSCWSAAGVMA